MILSLLVMLAAPPLAPQCAAMVTTIDINDCESRRFKSADRAMNLQWRTSLAKMKRNDARHQDPRSRPPSYAQALILAQRAWLQYRDANCLVDGYRVRGGTAQTAVELTCQTAATIDRTRELRDQVKGY